MVTVETRSIFLNSVQNQRKMKNTRLLRLTVLFLMLHFGTQNWAQSKTTVLLDADTANEVDDLFALSRILMDSSVSVLALNAAQWQNSHWSTPKSMEDSHRLNQMLLGTMGLSVKTNRGAMARMYDWGNRAQYSAAANEIIDQANRMKDGERLNLIALGALTNVASAVFMEPEIAEKIRLYWLGSSYDFEKGVLGRNDFNCAMDQYALTHLLFSEVEMHVIPVNVASKMTFDYDTTKARLKGQKLGDFLLKIWDDHVDGGRAVRTIWDLAIIDAFLHPEWATEITIMTSKDNGGREIFYYKDIDADKMLEDFFDKINAYKAPK